jgi:perosamine synthetase
MPAPDRIPVAGPSITQKEIDYVTDAVTNCWYGEANKYYTLFEEAFASYLGVKYAVTLPSCTSGLHLSLASLDIGSGDEVILPDITWIASAAPVSYVGGVPVFCDVDPLTWCLDVSSVETAINERTKAIIAVELYGGMPDWDALQALADKHGIPIIEDAAEAIGSEYYGRKSGSLGRTGVFSFHGSKTMTTGEGGLLATNDPALFDRVMFLRDHGRIPGDTMFKNTEVAFKYKMSAMQAAMGLAQLERIDELVGKKREIFRWYKDRLGTFRQITLNAEPEGTFNSYWMTSVIVNEELHYPKEALIEKLAGLEIQTRPFFSPLSSIPAYEESPEARVARDRNQTSYQISRQAINLPSSLSLKEEEADRVCESLLDLLGLS